MNDFKTKEISFTQFINSGSKYTSHSGEYTLQLEVGKSGMPLKLYKDESTVYKGIGIVEDKAVSVSHLFKAIDALFCKRKYNDKLVADDYQIHNRYWFKISKFNFNMLDLISERIKEVGKDMSWLPFIIDSKEKILTNKPSVTVTATPRRGRSASADISYLTTTPNFNGSIVDGAERNDSRLPFSAFSSGIRVNDVEVSIDINDQEW